MTRAEAVPTTAHEERVLVLTGNPRDAAITVELLAAQGIAGEVCVDVQTIAVALDSAGAALVAEEVLGDAEMRLLADALAQQQAWCDFPFVVFGASRSGEDSASHVLGLGNVSVLDRPVRTRTMIAAVRSALRGRRRQYAARREIHARDQFLAMLGHELRNPLAAIGVAAELLARSDDEEARARQRAVIDRQSKHLGRLVDDLLDVSRVTHGKVNLERRSLDVAEVLRTTAESFDHVATTRGVRTMVETLAPVLVNGDRLRLEQIVSNLLGNALKYTPRGGSVRAEARAEGDRAVVRVVDTGVGIDADMLPRVFDLFAQAEQSLDRNAGGMGLGLTLVQRLVTLHGGTVEARSAGLGRGSEFTVRLPLAEGARPAAPAPAVRVAVEGPRRVVLIDDSEDIRELFEELLRSSGHDVSTGADGPQGVEVIVDARPDVAFVDLGLPGFDGYEVARRVRAQLEDPILLVAMTGYGQAEDRARAMAAGFDRHLTKPVDIQALEALVAGAPRIARAG